MEKEGNMITDWLDQYGDPKIEKFIEKNLAITEKARLDMKPKEKAEELVNNFLVKIPFADTKVYEDWEKEMKNKSKQCALISVDEILDEYWSHNTKRRDWWKEVKKEIDKL